MYCPVGQTAMEGEGYFFGKNPFEHKLYRTSFSPGRFLSISPKAVLRIPKIRARFLIVGGSL
jgi:hypothetical protein